MSKERELIKDMKILLECTDMGGLQRNADVLIGRAIELLAQPEQEQEVYKKGYAQSELDLKPEDFSEEVALIVLKQICDDNREDLEVIHIEADKLLCALLEEKYPNLVKKFIELPKWYA